MQAHEPQVIEADLGPGVRAFFTTVAGGVSGAGYASLNLGPATGDSAEHVQVNRTRVAARAGMPVTYATQVHGTDVAHVAGPAFGEECGEYDALVTAERGRGLAVLVADCVPILLADPAAGVVGAVHAGRRGLGAGILERALAQMRAAGAREVRAVVGPAACGRCYEVPERLRAEVAAVHPAAWSETSWGTPALDLPGAAEAVLSDAGVARARVHRCTIEDPALFSYRRAAGAPTGRSAGVVGLI